MLKSLTEVQISFPREPRPLPDWEKVWIDFLDSKGNQKDLRNVLGLRGGKVCQNITGESKVISPGFLDFQGNICPLETAICCCAIRTHPSGKQSYGKSQVYESKFCPRIPSAVLGNINLEQRERRNNQ